MVLDWLLAYRWWILLGGGGLLLWLMVAMPRWRRVAMGGRFTAERDYARWRLHYGILGLVLLVPLVLLTAVASFLTAG